MPCTIKLLMQKTGVAGWSTLVAVLLLVPPMFMATYELITECRYYYYDDVRFFTWLIFSAFVFASFLHIAGKYSRAWA